MLPDSLTQNTETAETTTSGTYNIISTEKTLNKTPDFDFESKSVVISNGTPKMIADIDAIKNWMILFITTPKDIYPIYDGTGFGTSIRKLFGRKTLNNGFEEAEVEREIKEGFPLNPAINQVTSFNMTKSGRILKIYVQVELFDGSLVDVSVEQTITMK